MSLRGLKSHKYDLSRAQSSMSTTAQVLAGDHATRAALQGVATPDAIERLPVTLPQSLQIAMAAMIHPLSQGISTLHAIKRSAQSQSPRLAAIAIMLRRRNTVARPSMTSRDSKPDEHHLSRSRAPQCFLGGIARNMEPTRHRAT